MHIKQKEAKGQKREMTLFAAVLLEAATLGFVAIKRVKREQCDLHNNKLLAWASITVKLR